MGGDGEMVKVEGDVWGFEEVGTGEGRRKKKEERRKEKKKKRKKGKGKRKEKKKKKKYRGNFGIIRKFDLGRVAKCNLGHLEGTFLLFFKTCVYFCNLRQLEGTKMQLSRI